MLKQTMHKYGSIKKIIFLIAILSIFNCATAIDKTETKDTEVKHSEETDDQKSEETIGTIKEEIKPIYYTLVDKNLRPEETEYYLSSIYSVKGQPKALISRSNNTRAGEMFTFAVEYGMGDELSEDLVIKNIVLGRRKHIIVYQKSTQQYYMLKMSYGQATSRLVRLVEDKKQKS